MFDTARLAWSKMKFDARPLQLLEKFLETATNLTEYPITEERWGANAIIAGRVTSQEAKSIAIEMNLELLEKKNDDDEILYFLENELHGRRVRLHQHKLSDEQTRLLGYFAKLIDEFDYLCSPDNPEVPDDKASANKRALVITERDDLTKQIQYEITKPIDAADTSRSPTTSPESPQVQVQHTPIKQGEHIPMQQEEHTPLNQEKSESLSRSEIMTTVRKLELDAIQDFCNITGVDFEEAEKKLKYYDYNVNNALDFHYADQKASEQLASPDVDMDADPELEEAIRLSLVTESSDGEATQCNLPVDNSIMNDKPKMHAQLYREEAFSISKVTIGEISQNVAEIVQSHAQIQKSKGEAQPEITQSNFEAQHGKENCEDSSKQAVAPVTTVTRDISQRGRSHAG
jgi:hypothetical protein